MSEQRAVMTEREPEAPAVADGSARSGAAAGAPAGTAPRAETSGLSGLRKAAILLVTLDEDAAAAIFTRLPEDAAERIGREIAAMDAIDKEQVRAVVEEFRDLAEACRRGREGEARSAAAGAGATAALAFEDLLLVDDAGMQRLLEDIDPRRLALALKSASPELNEKMLRNMPVRAAEAVKEETRRLGPVRVADVEAAQRAIVDAARRLEEQGLARLHGRGGEGDVIV